MKTHIHTNIHEFIIENINSDERDMLKSLFYIKFDIINKTPFIFNSEIHVIKSTHNRQYGMVRIISSDQRIIDYLYNEYENDNIALSKEKAKEILLKFGYNEVYKPENLYDIKINNYKHLIDEKWLNAYVLWKYKNTNL